MDNSIKQNSPEMLDPEFGEYQGWLAIDRVTNDGLGSAVVRSIDTTVAEGRVYVCGDCIYDKTHAIIRGYFICCLNDLGRLNEEFGKGGYIVGDFPENFTAIEPTRLIAMSDGTLLMQAYGYVSDPAVIQNMVFVARFNASGNADVSFGLGGYFRHDFDGVSEMVPGLGQLKSISGSGVIGSSTGKFYSGVEGDAGRNIGLLYRLTERGELDFALNGSGILKLGDETRSVTIVDFVVTDDESIVVAGQVTHAGSPYANGMLARIDSRGQLDTSFGGQGTGFYEFSIKDHHISVSALASREKGAYVCVGTLSRAEPDVGEGFIHGIDSNGLADSSFGNGEVVETPVDDDYSAQWLSVLSVLGDKVLVSGRTNAKNSGLDTAIYLALYERNGTPDLSFGKNGTGRIENWTGIGNNGPMDMKLQPDRKVLVSVNSYMAELGAVYRYVALPDSQSPQ